MPVYQRLDHRDVERLMEKVNQLQATTKQKDYMEIPEEIRRSDFRRPRYLWKEVEEICRKAEETVRRDPMVVNRQPHQIALILVISLFAGFLGFLITMLVG